MQICSGIVNHICAFLRFKADHVPKLPQSRHITLSEHFFSQDLKRYFNYVPDHIHIPGNIDQQGVKCWMILDFNATKSKSDVKVDKDLVRIFKNS